MVTLLICFLTGGSQHHKRLNEPVNKSLFDLLDEVFFSYRLFLTRLYGRTRECVEYGRQHKELYDIIVNWFMNRNQRLAANRH